MTAKQKQNHRILALAGLGLVLVALAGLMPAAQAQPAQPDANAVVGTGSPASCTEAVLTDALNTVQGSGGGTITFNCGAAAHTIALSVYSQISSNVTIDGANKITLDGNNATAFYQVFNSASLTLKRITLRRGSFTGIHPLENFGTLTLDRATLAENVSGGSAVANYGTLTIRSSTLSANGVTGAGSLSGGAVLSDGGTLSVEDSTFSNNTIPGNSSTGGAIANHSGGLNVTGSTFSGNSAFDGGALYLGANTSASVADSTFDGNSAGYGGAVEFWGTQLIVQDATFNGNRATVGDGGAIWMLDGTVDVQRTQFTDNQATTTGGAISCYGNALSLARSSLSSSRAAGNGGAIYSDCTLDMTNNTLSDNQATGASSGGGAIYQTGNGAATIRYATIANNTAIFGAGIYNDGGGSSLTIGKSIVAHNATGNCDGVITSAGYNLTNNTGCGAFTNTGDVQNASLPLGPLADNGGPTPTRMLLSGNQAIDAVPAAECGLSVDQRGVARPFGSGCDSGAVEGASVERKIYLPLAIR